MLLCQECVLVFQVCFWRPRCFGEFNDVAFKVKSLKHNTFNKSSRSFSRRSEESEVLTAQLVFIRGMVIIYNEALNTVIMYVGARTIIEMFECMNIKRKHASENDLEEEHVLSDAKKRDEKDKWRRFVFFVKSSRCSKGKFIYIVHLKHNGDSRGFILTS